MTNPNTTPRQTTHRNFEPEDIERLQKSHDSLLDLADRACSCGEYGDGPPTDEKRCCDSCKARYAMQYLSQVLDPDWISCSPQRMRSIDERVYVREWRQRNQREPGLNGGYGTLELLLAKHYRKDPVCNRSLPIVEHVSQRDMEVATTIIQWLGTNCGSAFVADCERNIAEEKGIQRRYSTNGLGNCHEVQADICRVAEQIAENFISVDQSPNAARALAAAIKTAFTRLLDESLCHTES